MDKGKIKSRADRALWEAQAKSRQANGIAKRRRMGVKVHNVRCIREAWIADRGVWNLDNNISTTTPIHYPAEFEITLLRADGKPVNAAMLVDIAKLWRHVADGWAHAMTQRKYIHGQAKDDLDAYLKATAAIDLWVQYGSIENMEGYKQ